MTKTRTEIDVHAFNHVMTVLDEIKEEYLGYVKNGPTGCTIIEALAAIYTMQWLVPTIIKLYVPEQEVNRSKTNKECEPVLEV